MLARCQAVMGVLSRLASRSLPGMIAKGSWWLTTLCSAASFSIRYLKALPCLSLAGRACANESSKGGASKKLEGFASMR